MLVRLVLLMMLKLLAAANIYSVSAGGGVDEPLE